MALKAHLQNNKKKDIKAKLSDPKIQNTRAFYKTVKMFMDNQEKRQTVKNRK